MKCPSCNSSILPFKVWFISRWTFVKCGNCGQKLGRKIDVQLCTISFLLFLIYVLFILSGTTLLLAIPLMFIVMFIDAYTIKLIPKDKCK